MSVLSEADISDLECVQLEITPSALVRLVKNRAISLTEIRCSNHKTKMLLWQEYLRCVNVSVSTKR